MTAPSFEVGTAGRVVFGAGRATELGDRIQGWGTRAVVLTGSRPGEQQALLVTLPIPYQVLTVTGEPTVEVARAAVTEARAQRADVVIAIGGGSVLDVGKATAMLLGNGGDPLDYLEVIGAGRPISRASVPFAAVPTTAGTGAEVTENAVLASPEHGRKASLRSAWMMPRLALVDPLLTLGCPPAVTAASGLDALTQCLEPFVSPRANPITDALAREGLRRVSTGLSAAYLDGSDAAARADMSLASLLGGMSLANAKLGAVHGFAGVIGGLVKAPHGAICAALLAAVVETTVAALRSRDPQGAALDKYREAATLLTGRSEASIEDGIDWIRSTVRSLGIPGLESLGVTPDLITQIVTKTASASSTKGNPIPLTQDELRAALEHSFT